MSPLIILQSQVAAGFLHAPEVGVKRAGKNGDVHKSSEQAGGERFFVWAAPVGFRTQQRAGRVRPEAALLGHLQRMLTTDGFVPSLVTAYNTWKTP